MKAGNGEEATSKANLLKQAKLIKCSGETNEKEVARYAVDGDVKTKWCDTSTAPNYIDFDFGKEQTIRGWKLVNAGNEAASLSLIPASYKAETVRTKNGKRLMN